MTDKEKNNLISTFFASLCRTVSQSTLFKYPVRYKGGWYVFYDCHYIVGGMNIEFALKGIGTSKGEEKNIIADDLIDMFYVPIGSTVLFKENAIK
jgi:hypothetical protein